MDAKLTLFCYQLFHNLAQDKTLMAMIFIEFFLGILCVWRLTHLLHNEDGPWDIFVTFRRKLPAGFWNGLLSCFYCLSLWVSIPFALVIGATLKDQVLLWPALSAGAIVIESAISRMEADLPAQYYEDEEDDENDMLR